jgi:hypothetical protein
LLAVLPRYAGQYALPIAGAAWQVVAMPHWLIKSMTQRVLSHLPASHACNAFFQKHFTRSFALTPERFDLRLEFCRRHFDHFLECRPHRKQGFCVLELGTGWYPVVPLGLYLCGATEIWTFDIAPLLEPALLHQTLVRFDEYERKGTLRKLLPRLVPERLATLQEVASRGGPQPIETLLEPFRIRVRVRDAQDTGLPAGAVDLFVSTGVLEYIPREVLQSILREFKRVGSADAIQSHYVNLIDQFSYFDRSITPFNFLKFSSRSWKYLNSPLTWQNRLRISDYRALFSETGHQIVKEVNSSGSPEDLKRIQLAPEFRAYSMEDLLVTLSWLLAKPVGT